MSEKIYTRLLRLYPSSFRKKYEGEALQLIRDRLRDETGFFKRARLWWDLVADVLAGLPSAYRNSYAVTEAASLSLHAAGTPSFKILDKEPLGLGSILAGGTISLIALAAFAFLLSLPIASQPIPGSHGRMSPIESVMQRLNATPAPDSGRSSLQDAAPSASTQMSGPQAQPSTPGASTPNTSASPTATGVLPMAVNAGPRSEVATIKPGKPDTPPKMSIDVASIRQSKAGAAAPMPNFALHHGGLAQTTTQSTAQNIADTWQGTLHVGRDLRVVFKIAKADGGGYKAVFYSTDQSGDGLPVHEITLQGTTVKMSFTTQAATYDGKLSSDGKSITGTWTQGSTVVPLTLTRATPEIAWTIPPPTKLAPMDASAHPSFEVATIKPNKADQPGRFFRFRGRHFTTTNTTLNDLISYSYRIHNDQIIDAPGWAGTEKYDIDAQPDGEGMPTDQQWKEMMQKLLAERFALTSHHDKKELPVYVLSVAGSGPKLNKSDADPKGHFGWSFQGRIGGDMTFSNASMTDFATLMQRNVLDRPVVDQTGLAGRYDFNLNWTPDESQFQGMGAKPSPPTDSTNAPPDLYTAIQEQIGLKLDATRALAEVLVIDHVERPSEN